VRDMLSDSGFAEFSTETQRAAIEKLLGETSEWLYDAGSDAPGDALKAKLKGLRALTNPVQKRRKEAESRPDALKRLQESLEQTEMLQGVIKSALEEAEKLSAAADSSSSEAASKASAEAEASLSASSASATPDANAEKENDPLAELEEEEEPLSSTTTTVPSSTPEPFLSQYSPEDLTELTTLHSEVKTWLDSVLAKQEKLSKTDDPAFDTKDVEKKVEVLQASVMNIIQKQIRASAKAKTFKPKATSTPRSKKSKKAKSSSSTSGEESTVTFEVPNEETKTVTKSVEKETATSSIRDEL